MSLVTATHLELECNYLELECNYSNEIACVCCIMFVCSLMFIQESMELLFAEDISDALQYAFEGGFPVQSSL